MFNDDSLSLLQRVDKVRALVTTAYGRDLNIVQLGFMFLQPRSLLRLQPILPQQMCDVQQCQHNANTTKHNRRNVTLFRRRDP